jgi:hypothetical protein
MTQTQSEFFIEKEQLPVTVTMVTGEELHGSLFVQPTWRRPSLEFDAPDAYVPLELPNGKARLIAKAQVVLMRGTGAEGDKSGLEDVGEPAAVVMRCSNGVIVRGNLMIARVTSNMRVLDYLNRTAEEFILLHEPNGAVLVNRRHIAVVHDESDAAA